MFTKKKGFRNKTHFDDVEECFHSNKFSIKDGLEYLREEFNPQNERILIDGEASTLRIDHVLADAAPEFAAAALGAIAERHHIRKARALFDRDLAEITAL